MKNNLENVGIIVSICISLVLIMVSFGVHLYNLFNFKCNNNSSLNVNKNIKKQNETKFNDDPCLFCLKKMCSFWCIKPLNQTEFYPSFFVFNLVSSFIFVLMVLFKYILYGNNIILNDINTYCNIKYISKYYFLMNNDILYSNDSINSIIIDKILIYIYLIIIISDCYFHFHRYYSTIIATRTCTQPTQTQIFKGFILKLLFCLIVLAFQIHIMYAYFIIFPLILVSINVYYSSKFGNILIKVYHDTTPSYVSILPLNI